MDCLFKRDCMGHPEAVPQTTKQAHGPPSNSNGLLELDEFELIDKLATILGIAGPESQEARNTSAVYQRQVLRRAIFAIEQAWQK